MNSFTSKIEKTLQGTLLRRGALVDSLVVTLPESLFYWGRWPEEFHELTRDDVLAWQRAEFRIVLRGHTQEVLLSLFIIKEGDISAQVDHEGRIELQVPTKDAALAVMALIVFLAPYEIHVNTTFHRF